MVLSNLNNNMDVESRAMITMGDTLGRSGCYLSSSSRCPLSAVVMSGELSVTAAGLLHVASASRGLLDAAHFCYLMAQVGFGVYTKKTTKLVLIGSNHR